MPTLAELRITMDDKGRVAVTGPIDQTMLCYGLLEVAKDVLRRQNDEKAKKVQAPNLGELVEFGKR